MEGNWNTDDTMASVKRFQFLFLFFFSGAGGCLAGKGGGKLILSAVSSLQQTECYVLLLGAC